MTAVELDDLWKEERDTFSDEEEAQLWALLKIKLKRTLLTFHILGLILKGAPARHAKSIASTAYITALTRFDRAFQDFISCRKVFIHASPHPTRSEVDAIQAVLTRHYEAQIGRMGSREAQRRRIGDHDAKVRLLRETLKEGFRWMRGAGLRKVDFYRSMVLAADDGLICLREVYWTTKNFLVGEDASHDWLVGELSGLGLEEHLTLFLEEMCLVDEKGKFVCASLVKIPST